MHDVASEFARRGWRVTVLCSERGYENPNVRYPKAEVRDGVRIRRIALASFGKTNILLRVLGTASFLLQVFFRALMAERPSLMLYSTSPPMIGFVGALLKRIMGIPSVYWAMDLNPDQLVAMGKLRPGHAITRLLEWASRVTLRLSDYVVLMDRFMLERLQIRVPLDGKVDIIPPWPHESHVETVPHESNWFREKYRLQGKFVIMYSGNHSPANPLETLLQAMLRLKDDPRILFAFIGGGIQKKEVQAFVAQHNIANALLLPYQPIESLAFSLSAADAHVVSLGREMVGIVHPCKVYGAMTVGRPILFLGPRPSHVSDLLDEHGFGHHVSHGDVDGCLLAIERMVSTPSADLVFMGNVARRVLADSLSQQMLCGRMCDRMASLAEQHSSARTGRHSD
jgi:colanic acid biosynthesis glycosyl transferase WcaI